MRWPQLSKALLPVALSTALLAAPAGATWSVVVIDTATGEVCVASATCLAGFDLEAALPVVLVGVGGAAAQSLIDSTGANKLKIWNGFLAGDTPHEILSLLKSSDAQIEYRQYGIVNVNGNPAKFTGNFAGLAKLALANKSGTLRYAIQGNVLTGNQVITDAEFALLNTPGDLATKVLAAMEAARVLGGDGRCSCSATMPTSCGVPPPSFTKSAHTGFFVLARMGDSDGVCNAAQGCANGQYYANFNVIGGPGDPDPVLVLEQQYAAFRAALQGHPDGITSSAVSSAASLPADGLSQVALEVQLKDVESQPLPAGGAGFTMQSIGGPPLVTLAQVQDLGAGHYRLLLDAGIQTGDTQLALQVTDGSVTATLYPYLELRLDAPAPLHCGFDAVSAAAGADVPFVLDFGAANAGAPYLLLGSFSGTLPGTQLGELFVPLNYDALSEFCLVAPGAPLLPGSLGLLDANGRSNASFVAAPGLLAVLPGGRLDWSAVALGASPLASPATGFEILP